VGVVRLSSKKMDGAQLADLVVQGDVGDVAFLTACTRGCCAIIDLVCQMVPHCDSIAGQLSNDVAVLDACLLAGLANGARVVFASGNFSLPTKDRLCMIAAVCDCGAMLPLAARMRISQSRSPSPAACCPVLQQGPHHRPGAAAAGTWGRWHRLRTPPAHIPARVPHRRLQGDSGRGQAPDRALHRHVRQSAWRPLLLLLL
jgi:hypothetical protein